MSLTKDIKDFALEVGHTYVGITSADALSDHVEKV